MYNPKKVHYVSHTVIIVKNGKFLITKRSPKEEVVSEFWLVPGGSMKLNEYDRKPDTSLGQWYNTGERLCVREVKEEVGLEIPADKLRYVTSISFKRPSGIFTFMNSYFVVLSDDDEQEVVLGGDDEVTDFAWVTLEEAKEYNLVPGVWEELEMVDKILKGEDPTWERKH